MHEGTSMFEIDLLRGERVASRAVVSREIGAQLGALVPVLAGLAALTVALWAAGHTLDRRLAERRSELSALEATVNQSREELAELSGKRHALYVLRSQDIYWSDQLRLISEKLPDKTWLSQVHVITSGGEKDRDGHPTPITVQGLAVQGGVLSNPSEGNLDVVGKLIEDLQADPRFQRTFSDIRLDSVSRATDPNALSFQLTLSFKS
jgi:Tfp pilus assembly protein PilN